MPGKFSHFMHSYAIRNAKFILITILVVAALLRLYRVDSYGIFFDEKSTLLISQGVCLEGSNQRDVFSKPYFTPSEFWKPKTFADFIEANIRGDIGNSPAYYGVLWAWMNAFGLSDLSMRLPSVIFSTLLVLMLYIFVKRHVRTENPATTETIALTSCALAAVEPFFIAYSHMARNYSMTFLLTLLATHLFLLILERHPRSPLPGPTAPATPAPWWLYAAYGLTLATAVLSHYLAITVFACHGLYALLYLRDVRVWTRLALAGLLGFVPIVLWFVYGGGKYTFFTLNYQATLYRKLALTNPFNNPYGQILPATLPNILKRVTPIFADLFIVSNGLGPFLLSLRNTTVAVGLGIAATAVIVRYYRNDNPPLWVKIGLPALLLIGLPIYSAAPLHYMLVMATVPVGYLVWQYARSVTGSDQKRLLVLLALLAFFPTVFLMGMAWRSGHTFGITQRYSGFSFPYVVVLVAMGLHQLATLRWWFSAPLWLAMGIQAVFVGQLLAKIYADTELKYTSFGVARLPNPYWSAAQQLIRQYQPGDTILYPNRQRLIESKIDLTYSAVSLLDAQLVNVYLPPAATYWQRIDPAEPDKIVLRKGGTGQRVTIFDLHGSKYRY